MVCEGLGIETDPGTQGRSHLVTITSGLDLMGEECVGIHKLCAPICLVYHVAEERNIGAEAATWSRELAQEPNRVAVGSKAGVQGLEASQNPTVDSKVPISQRRLQLEWLRKSLWLKCVSGRAWGNEALTDSKNFCGPRTLHQVQVGTREGCESQRLSFPGKQAKVQRSRSRKACLLWEIIRCKMASDCIV